jgi:ubiquitin carboxyl-terminal hydrolase 36/42
MVSLVERRIKFTNRQSSSAKLIKAQAAKPRNDVSTTFTRMLKIGSGLVNTGVSCYINSVLQSLFYSPALANEVNNPKNQANCGCTFCIFKQTYKKHKSSTLFSPKLILRDIMSYAKHLRPNRQHDAHEFMLFFLDKLENDLSKHHNVPNDDNIIKTAFSGTLESNVKCHLCNAVSKTEQNFMDISLDIIKAKSLKESLLHYQKEERLDCYTCEKCSKTKSSKKIILKETPSHLIFHLKRFDPFGRKINKHLEFDPILDIATEKSTEKFELYSVLVHAGATVSGGHYYTYVKAEDGDYSS